MAAPQHGVHGHRGNASLETRHSPATASPKSCRPAKSPPISGRVLGAQPLLGRVFTEDEDARGARVVVISHGLWQRRFGASPDVLGRTITLNDSPYEVIGVMPREFYFMPARDIDIWMPAVVLRRAC